MKEMLDKCEVKHVKWVETGDMLADTLTKKGGNRCWITDILT